MNRDGIVELNDLLATALLVQDEPGLIAVSEQLKELEPCLSGYIENELTLIAGKMSLAGATPHIVREITNRVMSVVLIVFHAQRTAGVRLWSEAFPETPLAKLVQIIAAKKANPENGGNS